jgi:phosphoenolpyruvate carboxykinase (GTP)
MAGTLGSETTAAIAGKVGVVRRDPFAMIAFCGYNIARYFEHWLELGSALKHPPRIYLVNWFRRDENGKFLWPGYGENMRVLKWIIERVEGRGSAHETPLGVVPEELDLQGLPNMTPERIAAANEVCNDEWREELVLHAELVEEKLKGDTPQPLVDRYAELKQAFSS